MIYPYMHWEFEGIIEIVSSGVVYRIDILGSFDSPVIYQGI